jgi:hypothetical protein
LEKDEIKNSKSKCMFEPNEVTKENAANDFISETTRKISKEVDLTLEFINLYQKALEPFANKIENLMKYVLDEVYGFGKTQLVGSFGNQLFLPWSDLNFMVNCNFIMKNKKNNSQNNKSRLI